MYILGLTGSIAMGKTTAATMFKSQNIPVYDADGEVHKLMSPGGPAVDPVQTTFPDTVENGAVDRQKLGQLVFDSPPDLAQLESILHPLVRQRQRHFLRVMANRRAALVVLDVPLLFETGGERACDGVAVVSAPAYLQRLRVLGRPGMTEEKFQGILARQMTDAEKRRRADFVINTGLGKRMSLQSIQHIIKVVTGELSHLEDDLG